MSDIIYDPCGKSANDVPNSVDVTTNTTNTYRLATQGFVMDVVTSHNASEHAHETLTKGFIKSVNGNTTDTGAIEVTSIRMLDDSGAPQFQILADGTAIFNGVTSKIALTDGQSSHEKAERAYAILKACSADWEATNIEVESTSARNNAASITVEGLSGMWNSAYAETFATSARNREACEYVSQLKPKVPAATWNVGNSLADKTYVRDYLESKDSNYRGNFATWSDVPTSVSGYAEDADGNRTPCKNDIIFVTDCSELTFSARPSDTLIGLRLVCETKGLPAKHVLEAEDIVMLQKEGVPRITVYRDNMWRFVYTGTWSVKGKSGWECGAKTNITVFTEGQLAALNSGITTEDKAQLWNNTECLTSSRGRWNSVFATVCSMSAIWTGGGEVKEKALSVFATVSAASSNWNTVSGKMDLSSINYYTEAAWESLTRDDTDYSNVPYGFSLIYEDTTAEASPAYYGETTGLLLLSDSVTLSDGCLTMNIADTFNTTSMEYVMYGNLVNLNSFMITNNLVHAYNLNDRTMVTSGDPYAASIIAENGYYLKYVSCTMGGVPQRLREGNRVDISSVTGNIVITATGAPTGGTATYYLTSGALELPDGTEYLSSNGTLTFGTAAEYLDGLFTLNGAKA